MSDRVVLPDLFAAWGGVVRVADGTARVALRWMLHPSMGLPFQAFNVWTRKPGAIDSRSFAFGAQSQPGGSLVTWTDNVPAAFVRVALDVPSGQVTVRGHSGPLGGGKVVDQAVLTGPASGVAATLVGSAIASVSLIGSATVTGVTGAPIQELVDDPGWVLIDRVGLPADGRFAGQYSLDPQGKPGFDRDPVDAAIERVKEGTPALGWAAVTDRGTPAPAWEPPDPSRLVVDELAPLLDHLAELVVLEPDRARQDAVEVDVPVDAPTSVHGVAASARWQSQSHGTVFPLGTMLAAAGTDPFAALALGFGTTVAFSADAPPPVVAVVALASQRLPSFYLVTLEHKVEVDVDLGFGAVHVPFAAEIASLVAHVDAGSTAAPVAVVVAPPGPGGARLDRPRAVDEPWLEVAEVSWAKPARPAASTLSPTGYAVLESIGPADPTVALDPRPAGGFRTHAAAPLADDAPRIRFTRAGIAEPFPADPTGLVYGVAGHDWFGRWGPWQSADFTRTPVPPQVPSVDEVRLVLAAAGAGPAGTAAVRFTWDWSNRRPERVELRIRLHADGDPPPAVDGSVRSVGGPAEPDAVVDFSLASIDVPPADPRLSELVERRSGGLRTYEVELDGLTVDFGLAPSHAVRATVKARGIERVRPGVAGAWSPPASALAVSPTPPPPPFVPAAMQWASLPDQRGVARATLTWSPSPQAASYAVYHADETAVARELGLPSPALGTPAADRLPALRAADMGAARAAFRRVAENLGGIELAIELPRGSRLIHFYAVAPVGPTGAEGRLPAGGNDYLAVATPALAVPEAPVLSGVASGGRVRLRVRTAGEPVAVGRIEVTRVRGRHLASTLEAGGAPIITATSATGVHDGTALVWELEDPDMPPAWEPLYYHAVAWGADDRSRGVFAGRSGPSSVAEVVVPAADPPTVDNLRVDSDGSPDGWLASFHTDAPRFRTARGAHDIVVTAVAIDPATPATPVVTTRRAGLDELEVIAAPLPPVADLPPVFLFEPAPGDPLRVTALVRGALATVVAQVGDPAGRTTRATWPSP